MEIINLEKTINDDGMVSLPFYATDGANRLNDAIVGTADYIDGLTSDKILDIQTQRFTNWLSIINNPNPISDEITSEGN
jgi:hypothetical protein